MAKQWCKHNDMSQRWFYSLIVMLVVYVYMLFMYVTIHDCLPLVCLELVKLQTLYVDENGKGTINNSFDFIKTLYGIYLELYRHLTLNNMRYILMTIHIRCFC